MQQEKTLNMTEGSTIKLLILFSIPMLIGNLFQQFYNIVDSVIVGKLVGAEALAAIGVTGSITFSFIGVWGICFKNHLQIRYRYVILQS